MTTLSKKVLAIENNLEKLNKDEYDCLRDFYNRGKSDMEFVYKIMVSENLI